MCIEWNSINLASNALLHIFTRKTKSSPLLCALNGIQSIWPQMSFCKPGVTEWDVTPRPTDSSGESEDCTDEAEELCYSSLFRIYVTPIWS